MDKSGILLFNITDISAYLYFCWLDNVLQRCLLGLCGLDSLQAQAYPDMRGYRGLRYLFKLLPMQQEKSKNYSELKGIK